MNCGQMQISSIRTFLNRTLVNSSGLSGMILVFALLIVLSLMIPGGVSSQRPESEVHGVFDGDTMYTVLPADAIPAILEPVFLSGEEGDSQMSPDEMVLGILLDGEARAYSLWQLDAHEIVNDSVGGLPIAPTW